MENRICNICQEEKNLEKDFSFIVNRNRYMNYCKKCNNKKHAKYRLIPKNKKYHDDYQQTAKYKKILSNYKKTEHGKKKHREDERKRRHKLKEQVICYYSSATMSCVHCSYKDMRALSIDHIDGGGKKHREYLKSIGSQQFYTWLRKNNFPPGFQVLCMNCQFVKRVERKEHTKLIE